VSAYGGLLLQLLVTAGACEPVLSRARAEDNHRPGVQLAGSSRSIEMMPDADAGERAAISYIARNLLPRPYKRASRNYSTGEIRVTVRRSGGGRCVDSLIQRRSECARIILHAPVRRVRALVHLTAAHGEASFEAQIALLERTSTSSKGGDLSQSCFY